MSEIELGTTFREQMTTWKVIEDLGGDKYLCRVEEQYVMFECIPRAIGYGGAQRTFSGDEIRDLVEGQATDPDHLFYCKLKPGDVIHWDHSAGRDARYVRCMVVGDEVDKGILPIALVGYWDREKLPYRDENGDLVCRANVMPAVMMMLEREVGIIPPARFFLEFRSDKDLSCLPVIEASK